jgi:tRNA(adenine34) deaminase
MAAAYTVMIDRKQPTISETGMINPMVEALKEAQLAASKGEVPVGAVVTGPDGAIIARAGNRTEALYDASAHAEMLVLRQAAACLSNPRLVDCDLFVTLEPCPMCAHAISLFRVRRLIFGAYDPKGGGVEHGPRIFQSSSCHHAPTVVGGVRETEASEMLQRFFQGLRGR